MAREYLDDESSYEERRRQEDEEEAQRQRDEEQARATGAAPQPTDNLRDVLVGRAEPDPVEYSRPSDPSVPQDPAPSQPSEPAPSQPSEPAPPSTASAPSGPSTQQDDRDAEWQRVQQAYARAGVPIGETDRANFQGKKPEDVKAFADALVAQSSLRARPTFSAGGIGGDVDLDQNGQLDPGWYRIGGEGGGRFTRDAALADVYQRADPNTRDRIFDALQAGRSWQSATPANLVSAPRAGFSAPGIVSPGVDLGGFAPRPGGGGGTLAATGQAALEPGNNIFGLLQRQYQDSINRASARDAELAAERQTRRTRQDELYNTLKQRAAQAQNVDPNDPIIAAQVDAYGADQERARRNLVSDAAEAGRPLSDTQKAMSAERVGQAAGGLRAELMSRELQNRRAEIASALSGMGGLLDADQQEGLQRELGNIDAIIRQQQLGLSGRELDLRKELGFGDLGLGYSRLGVERELGLGGQQNDLLRTLLGNQQFYSDLGSRNDQFSNRLGFDYADRSRYWDAVNRGLIR